MTISFDLDDTIIPGTKQFETQKQNIFQKLSGIEKIRKGTTQLFRVLHEQGHNIVIYTTSFRSKRKIWCMFFSYGIRIGRIINQDTHIATLRDRSRNHSKYPPAFGIDIHVDDSKGVEMEGERYSFHTIIIDELNVNWGEHVLQLIEHHSHQSAR